MSAFDAALAGDDCWLAAAGRRHRLPVLRWRSAPDRADAALLTRCAGPTIDVGCGPGRLTAALAYRGIVALGVDTSTVAVRMTRQRGAAALRRDVFARLPGEGRWRHVLLADGNIGIGGDPAALLARCAELIGPAGTILVELDPLVSGVHRGLATIEHSGGRGGPFPWAAVGPDAVRRLAAVTRLAVTHTWQCAGRAFAELARP